MQPHVCQAFPLDQAVEAMRLLENREVIGKCVVTANGYLLES
ncbi:MAG: zinc-binding dehydrogenase [Gammaproteobacteria bacterium]|nr:zinc-binding dehydrogenase [Gammaproteobacteria bacterium]